ncbi:hypothetical protein T484DRAFT_2189879 [Baffinella frigidus]|nr:hypothetical protein T484DRAFT_2189879 [Cryptophyta sp. CCMP2293]
MLVEIFTPHVNRILQHSRVVLYILPYTPPPSITRDLYYYQHGRHVSVSAREKCVCFGSKPTWPPCVPLRAGLARSGPKRQPTQPVLQFPRSTDHETRPSIATNRPFIPTPTPCHTVDYGPFIKSQLFVRQLTLRLFWCKFGHVTAKSSGTETLVVHRVACTPTGEECRVSTRCEARPRTASLLKHSICGVAQMAGLLVSTASYA